MDDSQLRALRIINLLQKKADRTDNADEKAAIRDKIAELRVKYKVGTDPWLITSPGSIFVHSPSSMSREEFVRSFFGDPQPNHVTYFPSARGKTYFATWIADMDPSPTANEEGWELIDNSENEW